MSENNKPPGFFGQLFELLDLVSRLSNEKDTVHREGTFGGHGIAGHWSVTARLGAAAANGGPPVPSAPPTGAVKPQEAVLVPRFEVHDEGAFLRVIVTDLPEGAEAAENIAIRGDLLLYDNPDNGIHTECLLPCAVEREPLSRTFSHGLLVMDLRKAGRNPDER